MNREGGKQLKLSQEYQNRSKAQERLLGQLPSGYLRGQSCHMRGCHCGEVRLRFFFLLMKANMFLIGCGLQSSTRTRRRAAEAEVLRTFQ